MVEATGLGVLHAAPANSHTGLFGLLFSLSTFIYFVSKQVGSRRLLPPSSPVGKCCIHQKGTAQKMCDAFFGRGDGT